MRNCFVLTRSITLSAKPSNKQKYLMKMIMELDGLKYIMAKSVEESCVVTVLGIVETNAVQEVPPRKHKSKLL